MYLNEEMARSIMEEISNVIQEDLNIMDETGLILASTDPKRINTFHEGAHILINSKLDKLIVENDGDYNGCRRGVNLPIEFAAEIVGAIGITGNPAETVKYGLILKKMTEMILYENFRALELFASKKEKDLLISDLIHGNLRTGRNELEKRMQRNGISINGPFTVAIIYNTVSQDDKEKAFLHKVRKNQIEHKIVEEFTNDKIHVMFNGEMYIVLANMNCGDLYKKIKVSASYLNFNSDISLLCFIGNDYEQYIDLNRSYNEAINILNYFKGEKEGIYLFNTVMLDFIINQLPDIHKENLKNQIFQNCAEGEQEVLCNFIKDYFYANGSLNVLAEKYYAHKNTIQYKITKIKKRTGYDLRSMHDLFLLYMAAICTQ